MASVFKYQGSGHLERALRRLERVSRSWFGHQFLASRARGKASLDNWSGPLSGVYRKGRLAKNFQTRCRCLRLQQWAA